MLSDMLGWGASQPEHQFDAQLKKQSVTLEDSSRICRGAPANGDSPIDGYWSALCDKPLLRNTGRCLTLLVEAVPVRAHHAPRGLTSAPRRLRISPSPRFPWAHTLTLSVTPTRHTVTFRVLSKGNEGRSDGWAVVGMASPSSSKGSGPGGADDSLGVGSDGTSSVGPCPAVVKAQPYLTLALAPTLALAVALTVTLAVLLTRPVPRAHRQAVAAKGPSAGGRVRGAPRTCRALPLPAPLPERSVLILTHPNSPELTRTVTSYRSQPHRAP